MQRLAVRATTRLGRDAELAANYLKRTLEAEGATITHASGAAKKRGGAVQVIADAPDAMAVMNAARKKLDADTNAYLLDILNELQIASFESSSGGMLGFVTEDFRLARETL